MVSLIATCEVNPMNERVLVKKYTNRRLYDTEKNAYVTLQQVAQLIKEGRQVEVIDAKTKEDVTAFILTQIILEEARRKNILLPVPLLHLFIRYGETLLNEFFEKHLQHVLQHYLTYKSSMDKQFEKWLEIGTELTDHTQRAMTSLAPYKSVFDVFLNKTDRGKNR
jgi:polyhydroxyalkanoate synthesis repressor PhaR